MSVAANTTLPLRQDGASPDKQAVHLLPAGRIVGRDGRAWVANDLPGIIRRTMEHAGKTRLPVDYEHQTMLAPKNGQPAPAAGWITALQSRADGIWGLVEWTPRAANMLANKEYKYISPVFSHDTNGNVLLLLNAALTNMPNLDLVAAARQEVTMGDDLQELRGLLGLPDTAGIPEITARVRDMMMAANTAATPDPSEWVPMGAFEKVYTELLKTRQGVSQREAEIAVNAQIQAGHMIPAMRDWGIALCTVNKPAFDAFIERTMGGVHQLFEVKGPFGQPGRSGGALSAEDMAVCSTMNLDPADFSKYGRG